MAGSDEILVEKCQNGDHEAFELLLKKYQRRIFHLIYRITQDASVVEPLAQEVFLKAYRAICSFKGDSRFYTWLYRIAVNTCLSYVKRPRPEETHSSPLELNQGRVSADALINMPEDPEKQVMRKEILRAVMSSVKDLPEDLRTAIVLREFMDLNYEEISDVMQIPLGTVRSRIFRARARLREVLEPRFHG